MPSSADPTGSGLSRISRHALPTAINAPARFPLSTDDTYLGSSVRASFVSYQL